MRLLIDTHILLWAAAMPDRLSPAVSAAIIEADNTIFVSAATAWELSIKVAAGRLDFPVHRFDEILTEYGFEPLPISPDHAIAAGSLVRLHNDPFDRILVAQAHLETLMLVTDDAAIRRYPVALFGA